MPHVYSYAVVRLVPRVERQEFVNIGVLVYCHALRYLKAVLEPDRERIKSLFPSFDFSDIESDLPAFVDQAAGIGGSPIAQLSPSERFHWLAAVRSTVLQLSPTHTGVCDDLDACVQRLLDQQVRA